jgi:hypothetical protein
MKPSNREWLGGFRWGVGLTSAAFVVLGLLQIVG